MKILTFLSLICMPFFGCKCRLAKNPLPTVYGSMAISKENNAFINEFQAESAYISMRGNKYYIEEAWVERTHLEKNFRDIFTGDRCLVINFHFEKNDTVDLHSYVKEDGNSVARIWFNLSDEDYTKDTLVVYYRETLDSAKKNKTFLFFKKK
jgi:hypothetical protein